jgi:hypothetical protein
MMALIVSIIGAATLGNCFAGAESGKDYYRFQSKSSRFIPDIWLFRMHDKKVKPIFLCGSAALRESPGFSRAKGDGVESSGRLSPIPLLPLVKPDVRISRIRLSCKRSSLPTLIRSATYTFFSRNRLGLAFGESKAKLSG